MHTKFDAYRPLNNLERRVMAHLPIPRNIAELTHELRTDPHSPVGASQPEEKLIKGLALQSEDDVNEFLMDHLSELGYVVNLGHHDDPARLVAHLPKSVIPMADEQGQIYTRRRKLDTQRWKLDGDLWMLTKDGLDALREPGPDEPGPMTPTQIRLAIQSEAQRLHTGKITDTTRLNNKLLPAEFRLWLDDVLYGYDKLYSDGKEFRRSLELPNGILSAGDDIQATGWTDVYENRILDHENQKTAMPALVAPWFMALTILAFTDTDTATTSQDGSHKPSYTGYADKSVAAADMSAASGGSASNANAIVFANCTAGSSTVVGFGNKETNGTTGDLRKYGTCASTTVSTTQTPPQFAAGAYTTTAD